MSFRKILIAVDESAFSARAADVGFELARSLGAEVAIHVVDPAVVAYAPEGGIPASELVILAQQDGKRLLAAFGQRAGLQPAPLEFIHVGKTATEIVRGKLRRLARFISVCRMVNGPVHCGSVYCQTNAVVYRRSYEGAK